MTRSHPELAATPEDRDALRSLGVELHGLELMPAEGAKGHHIAVWVDDEIEIEFMVGPEAPVAQIVETLKSSLVPALQDVEAGSLASVAVSVEIVDGRLRFGRETARSTWPEE